MGLEAVSLDDKYDLAKNRILITGTQAIVRLTTMQAARDARSPSGRRATSPATGDRRSAPSTCNSGVPARR